MDLGGKRILVTGGAGFLGRAVCARLRADNPAEVIVPRSATTDLRRVDDCARAVRGVDLIIHLAARCGGIGANRARPGEFLHDNAIMGLHLMEAARQAGVAKFVLVGTCCSYPKHCQTPFREADLWTGFPEETNAPYGLAKRLLLAQAQAYRQQYGFNAIALIPANLYGPGDCFELDRSHVIPALIRKVVEGRHLGSITLWGSGRPSRDFLFVEDAADGIVCAAESYDGADPINLGSGVPTRIIDLAGLICRLVGFAGTVRWDATMPDGQPERWLDIHRARDLLGWGPTTPLTHGLRQTIADFTGDGSFGDSSS
jgi:GDP-L-fucose synthase